ncbi:MAG: (2Fe-2S) ferredoxin domain-containing protein [Oscillospiraceae bacterium]|jgi:NADP-reducing hydrogenase subunit HndB|nr:(2Fe-2S) ferredoxin domain-containing protein [Oscillospiraceae bacterium]
MKSLAELAVIKDKMRQNETVRTDGESAVRIVVSVGECGFAAGAREIVSEISAQLAKKELHHVTLTQTDCIGMCELEPVMEIFTPDREKVTYVHLTTDKIAKIISSHVENNVPVQEYMK